MTTENTSIQVVAAVEPQITTGVGTAIWNNTEVTEYLERKLEKYKDLVVTADNLKEMKGVLREIVSIRTKLQAFGTEQKRLLKVPYNTFVGELEQVMAVVSRVESPISNQIQVFEEEEKEKRKALVMNLIDEKLNALGIREEYRNRFVPNPKWWENKTAKIESVAGAIDEVANEILEQQRNDDEAIRLKQEKVELIKLKVDLFNSQYDLNTAIAYEDIAHKLENVSLSDLDGVLQDEFDKRLEVEMRASQKSKEIEEHKTWTTNEDYHQPITAVQEAPKRITYVLTLTDEQAKKLEMEFNRLQIEWSRI